MKHSTSRSLRAIALVFAPAALAILGIAACNQSANTTATAAPPPAPAQAAAAEPKPAISPTKELDLPGPEEEYGEFLPRPTELANMDVNVIAKSLRYSRVAMALGRKVYDANCASCHGADLKGTAEAHTPDLTDNVWRYSGDDVDSGGITHFPSDVEYTVRHGIRSGDEFARGTEADMLAFDPQYRNKHDVEDFGTIRTLTDAEIDDVAEYVLQLGRQPANRQKAARGKELFLDNAKGNCFDCHGEDGTGILAFGSSNLTQPKQYLFGSDRASIVESIVKGRVGVMPAFGDKLKPEELKSVSLYVFSRAGKDPTPPAPRR